MAIPSLAMIPSGYKDGKVYSVLPSNGDGDFTFSRGSNATRVNKDGLIETVTGDLPRLDYTDSSCPSLLLEPQSTNLLPYSEDFSDSSWSLTNSSVSVNTNISPDGTQNADTFTATNSSAQAQSVVLGTTGLTYTNSIWLKRKTGTGQVYLRGIENISTPITITDEWARYSFTAQSSNGLLRSGILLSNAGDEVYVWGSQLEQQSYATSYIPTNGAIATRYADECNSAGTSDTFNSSEGVLYAEMAALDDDLSERRFGISDGTSSNVARFGYTSASNRITAVVYNGSNQASLNYDGANITDFNKIALKYKENDFALWVNGVERSAETSGSVFNEGTLNSLNLDAGNGLVPFYGKVKEIIYYNTALTDEELTDLTKI
jgi:hypothetical protein